MKRKQQKALVYSWLLFKNELTVYENRVFEHGNCEKILAISFRIIWSYCFYSCGCH